jgi:AraC family transcriptional regulator
MKPANLTDFWARLAQLFQMHVVGRKESWRAPVAKFICHGGVGEAGWVEELPETIVYVRLGGVHTVRARGLGAGKTSAQGGFTLQPKGTSNAYLAKARTAYAQIPLSDALLDRASEFAGQPRLSSRLRPDLIFDPTSKLNLAATTYVQRALDTRSPPLTLEMEGHILILLDQLLALHGNVRPDPTARGGLAPWQLRRVTDFMLAHQADNLLLADLARLVDLSPKHFARAFRQSTGMPPHRWLMERRIERARELLVVGNVPIADIALACGFFDQSHFTTAFRRLVGTPPATFRRVSTA